MGLQVVVEPDARTDGVGQRGPNGQTHVTDVVASGLHGLDPRGNLLRRAGKARAPAANQDRNDAVVVVAGHQGDVGGREVAVALGHAGDEGADGEAVVSVRHGSGRWLVGVVVAASLPRRRECSLGRLDLKHYLPEIGPSRRKWRARQDLHLRPSD